MSDSSLQRPLPDNTHNTHNRHTSMPSVGFEPTISAGKWPQTYALDHVVTGTDSFVTLACLIINSLRMMCKHWNM